MRTILGREEIPAWMGIKPFGMTTDTTALAPTDTDGADGPRVTLLRSTAGGAQGVVRLTGRRATDGCLIDADDTHQGGGVILNPDATYVRDSGNRVALVFENLVYIGQVDAIDTYREAWPYARVGSVSSPYWYIPLVSAPNGWVDNAGRIVDYPMNPTVEPGDIVMATHAPYVSRMSGLMARNENRSSFVALDGQPRSDGDHAASTWELQGWIVPRAEHRPTTQAEMPVPVTAQPESDADLSQAQRIDRLNERFQRLTLETAKMSVEKDWCSEYEDAAQNMGLASADYDRDREGVQENTSWEITLEVEYELSASSLDVILANEFSGQHDVRDSSYVTSRITVTGTQRGAEFDSEQHDFDELLEAAGYEGFGDVSYIDSEQV